MADNDFFYEREVRPGVFARVTGDVRVGGSFFPFSALTSYSDADLRRLGVFRRQNTAAASNLAISRRQFYAQLAIDGVISEAEAEAAMGGTLPALLEGLVSALPASQQFAARMHLKGSGEFQRSHPLTDAIGAAQGKSPAEIDAFFQSASTL